LVIGLLLTALPLATAQAALPEQFQTRGKHAAAHPYLVDPGLEGPGTALVPATAEETARGFVVFSKPASMLLAPSFVPGPGDRCASLEARDCPGQYGPITFTVFTLRPCVFTASVTDLVGPGGRRISAKSFDLRAVRYVRAGSETIPLLLEAFDRKAVPARRLQQFWITYHIPENAAAGIYRGEVRIHAAGSKTLALPLRLRVNPFRLVEPDTWLYIYTGRAADPEAFTRDLIDQRCHGMNVSTIDMPVQRDGTLTREAAGPWLDAYKRAGFAKPYFLCELYNRIAAEWLNTPDKSIGMWGPWFRYYPFSETLDRRYVETVRMVRVEARKRGLEPVLAVADEPGSHPWTIPAAQHYNDLIKKELPDVFRELTVGGGWATGQPEHELWRGRLNIWTTNRWLPDKLAIVHREDPAAKIQLYNMGGAGSAPGGIQAVRNLYGFFNWKAKAVGVAQWVYWSSSTPDDNYVWPAETTSEGKVPTLHWEAVREGAKDRRYLATLEKLLARRPDTEAQSFLEEIAGRIELKSDTYDPVNGGRIPAQPAGTYEQWRDRIADWIERLSK
jgi:hypothetical protein